MTTVIPIRPRIGIPWRSAEEEADQSRVKLSHYQEAVRKAGAEPVLLSLLNPKGLAEQLEDLDGFVLPGSSSDVAPERYGSVNKGLSEPADLPRERTDWALLDHALAAKKPVLAICYGCQLLNVYLGGTLIQDLRTETGTAAAHRKRDLDPQPVEDPRHGARFEPGSRLAGLAGSTAAVVNSSHHQAVAEPGKNLKVTGRAPDGVIEGVEWIGDANWVVGVQWHPERMAGDVFAERIFADFVSAVRKSARVIAAGQ